MATAWTVAATPRIPGSNPLNKVDGILEFHPANLTLSLGAAQGTTGWSGMFRAVRCLLQPSGAGTYTTGGDTLPDVGLKHIEALLLVGGSGLNIFTNGLVPGIAQAAAAQAKLKLFQASGAEAAGAAAVAATTVFDVIILGRSG